MSKKLLLFLCFSSANPFKPLFLSVSSTKHACRAFGCFVVLQMQCQPVRRDWAVGDGDWVWNGAGQLQGIWTGLMDPFETRRGLEQRGSPQGHVCSEPFRACHMPFCFSPDRASAAPHLDAIGVRQWGTFPYACLESWRRKRGFGTGYVSNLTNK